MAEEQESDIFALVAADDAAALARQTIGTAQMESLLNHAIEHDAVNAFIHLIEKSWFAPPYLRQMAHALKSGKDAVALWMVEQGHADCVDTLIIDSPLFKCIEHGNLNVARAIFARGVVTADEEWYPIYREGMITLCSLNRADRESNPERAARRRGILELFYEHGFDIHHRSEHALRIAATQNDAETAKYLIEKGARCEIERYAADRTFKLHGSEDMVKWMGAFRRSESKSAEQRIFGLLKEASREEHGYALLATRITNPETQETGLMSAFRYDVNSGLRLLQYLGRDKTGLGRINADDFLKKSLDGYSVFAHVMAMGRMEELFQMLAQRSRKSESALVDIWLAVNATDEAGAFNREIWEHIFTPDQWNGRAGEMMVQFKRLPERDVAAVDIAAVAAELNKRQMAELGRRYRAPRLK